MPGSRSSKHAKDSIRTADTVFVEDGELTGIYYIPISGLPHTTTWQQLKDHVRRGCGVEADKIEVYAPLGGCVRIRERDNFDKAFTFLNGSTLNGRALFADGRNKGGRVMVKPTIAVPLTVRPTASLETDPAPAYGYGFSRGGAAGGMIPAFTNMAISGSPAVYGAAQPYGGHVVAPYPETPLMISPYSVDPAWNPYASIGQPYNAHQSFSSDYATRDHGQDAHAQSYVAVPVYHSPPVYPEGYNNYEGTIATAATPPIPVQVQRNNSIANSLASVPSFSTPTTTIIANIGTPNIVNTINTAMTAPSPPPNARNLPFSFPITSPGLHPMQAQPQQQQPHTILITGLAKKDLTPDKIRLLISKHVSEVVAAQIQGIQISDRKETTPHGYTAYVRFKTIEDAELVVAHLDKKLFGKNTLGVKIWVPERGAVFVGEEVNSSGGGRRGGGGRLNVGGVAAEGERRGGGVKESDDEGGRNDDSKNRGEPRGKGKEKSVQGTKDAKIKNNSSRDDDASGQRKETQKVQIANTPSTSTSAAALAVPPKLGHRRESTGGVVIAHGSYTTNTTTTGAAAAGKKDRSSSLSAMYKSDVVIARGSWATTKLPRTRDRGTDNGTQ
ncbi:hypothetical protein GE21DRAFT_4832 [Neurospora crassa]|uniref:RRM domain-containing protein n=1 Tax=Neurospora crassa (strain ATCC 24698 / 74-OR23-1A / CBS 708.71 / DSM 1257 / FGSC 987) TaxID=367110 RepID=Q7RW34_NEUCR|nr:hypothetical protein NCU00496 [Neurospora crassa OR74A]EAA26551.1 hypothetical protein NCU00496 [Neurospora crassa OR74A]KHE79902.1 hypothetical protein GE21DRAFT_4832 [Neurospora crassa]|eukprot:XP_955787.1 hypothetical protein NCU00496 [Neurospora crassa OR74A]